MPLLSSHRDDPTLVAQRAAQADPWVMYLVVRSDLPADLPTLLLAAARATVRCVEAHASTPTWAGSFQAWGERSFRKVTLRARGAAWGKVMALDAGQANLGDDPLVCALPPRLRSECGPLIRSLQVFNPEPSSLPAPPADAPPPDAPSMAFVLNPDAPMSPGKQMAQVAHAVLLCAGSAWATDPRYTDAFAAWRAAGHPCHLLPSSRWSDLHAHADGVVVRDAGLTEVDPGTETVIGLVPA